MGRKDLGPGPGKYMLPPVVGFKDHDVSRHRNPQYSMGTKYPSIDKRFGGPGPQYNVDKLTNYGKVTTAAFSMKSRHRPLTSFQTPGPGTYRPELAPRMKEPRPPAFTIAHRYQLVGRDDTPGPNKYLLPTTIGPKVPDLPASNAFSITSSRPQTGIDKSPGPARYPGISTDLYKNQLPKYTLPSRVYPPDRSYKNSPGPIYMPKLPRKPGYSFGLRVDAEPYITADDDMPCVTVRKTC